MQHQWIRAMVIAGVLAVLPASDGAMAAEPKPDRVTREQTGDNAYELFLESQTVFEVEPATRRLLPIARELCGDKTPNFTRYRFEKDEVLEGSGDSSTNVFRLWQQIECTDAARSRPQATRSPQLATEAEVDAVRANVKARSEAFFSELYSRLGDDAEAALSRTEGPGSDRSSQPETAEGTEIELNLYRVTVYDNIESAPANGVYVAVDYDNRVGNVAHHCGYLMWHSFDAESFKLGRIDGGTISAELVEQVAEDQLPQLQKQMRCANFYD